MPVWGARLTKRQVGKSVLHTPKKKKKCKIFHSSGSEQCWNLSQ